MTGGGDHVIGHDDPNASLRFRLWSLANRLNANHGRWAWFSLFSVMLTDLYIRLVAMGVITDVRWIS